MEREKKRAGDLLAAYLKQRLKTVFVFGLFVCIFATVFYLYNIPGEAVRYATLLFCAATAVLTAADFFFFCKKWERLRRLTADSAAACAGLSGLSHLSGLPAADGPLEEEYQELIRLMAREQAGLVSAEDSRRQEMRDYYTLWTHQIKTPIAAMDLLLQQGAAGALRGALAQELFKIGQYADMALQYQRLESMAGDLVLKECDLDDLVNQAVKKFASSFIYKKIKLERRETGAKVLTDEKWLVFALGQLLSNALKYTPEGGRISIAADENARAQGRTVLVLADTGIGIQAEDLPRIFERGFTGMNGRMDQKATGLGLYLCEEILRRLSHRISIASKAGEGTEVRLDLTRRRFEVE